MKVDIGYENSEDAHSAGFNVARMALEKGQISDPGVVLAFCHGTMDHSDFFEGLRSAVGGDVPIIGGSAIGIITNDHLCYEGCPAGAAILSSPTISCHWAYAGGLDRDEKAAGEALGRQIPTNREDLLFLLLYDSIKWPPSESSPPVMNASPLLIKGVEKTMHTKAPIIGAGVLGHVDFRPTQQFCGNHVGTQEAVGLMLCGDYSVYHCVMHGCALQDGIYRTITRIEGAKIYELDGQSIVSIIDEIYGNQEWQKQMPLKRLAIGINQGNPFEDFKEENYVNRLITGVLPDKDGIMIFEPDLAVGSRIQFMLRDSQEMILSARNNTEKLMSKILADQKRPVFGLYIDCAGRTAALSDTMTEEASAVVGTLNRYQAPLLGFYSGVEVAPMFGRSIGLDWTGVLTVIAR
ncbi:FIST N-terminal domain-containing protein [Desulfosarcina sp.]|uniref:FIST N-terminal domain-containing protein n=1 Tax=Desulfosarcina sp. TaxID=2027861 RepID=UPI0035678790